MSWRQTYSGLPRSHVALKTVENPACIATHELEFTNDEGAVHVVGLVRRSDSPGENPRLRIISRRTSEPEPEDCELRFVWFMPAEILPTVLASIQELMERPYV